MAKTQPQLPGLSKRHRPGTLEQLAMDDMRRLRENGLAPESSLALQESFRHMAREIDRAEKENPVDRWAKINCSRQMLNIWTVLVPSADSIGASSDALAEFLASIPPTPTGHPAKPEPADVRRRGRKVASPAEPPAHDAAPAVRARRSRGDRPGDGPAMV